MSTAAQRAVVAHADRLVHSKSSALLRAMSQLSLLGTVDKKAWLEAALETYGGLSASTDVSEDGDVTKLTVKQDSAKGMYAFLCFVSRSFIGHLWLVGATQGTFPFRP